MTTLIVLLIWLAGAGARVYRQAHYFQLEEYMNARYLRWVFARRERWLPNRPLTAWLAGTAALFLLAEAPGSPLPIIIGAIAGAIAGWPPRRAEVKKPFRATSRARRLLAAAWALTTLGALLALAAAASLPDRLQTAAAASLGFALLLGAPLLLTGANLLLVPLESYLRRRFEARARRVLDAVRPVVIGITGSYGKTSTKTYLAHILNGRYKAYPTPKSYNTLMGVCLAINNDLADDHSVDYFIAEMGAYIPGEIARICALTRPTISLVTEVGPQHLERFGSLENVALAKYEIIRALPADGVGIFNWDNPFVREMYTRGYPQTRIAVSREADPAAIAPDGPRFIASDITETADALAFTVTDTATGAREAFNAPLLGRHNVTNILLATAAAVHEGMTLREVAWRVASLQPAEARLARQVTPTGITIINDAYSANPVGAASALSALARQGTTGRRLLVTPGMVELGPLMATENRRLGEIAARHATDVILVGPEQTVPIREGLVSAGFAPERVQTVHTLAEAVTWYQQHLKAGDTVLFLNDLPDTYST